jgi:hypothetical protein
VTVLAAGALGLLPSSSFAVGGDFVQPVTSPESAGQQAVGIVSEDFNGDDEADLAIANATSNNLTLLLGNGMGDFTAALNSPEAGFGGSGIAAGDLDGDDDMDLAVAGGGDLVSGSVKILLNDGFGDFTAAASSPEVVVNNPKSVSIADMDNDMELDVVVGQFFHAYVTVLINNDMDATGNFTALPQEDVGGPGDNVQGVVAAPIDNDADNDVLVYREFSGSIQTMSNNNSLGDLVAQGMGFDTGGAGNATAAAVGQFGSNAFNDVALGNRQENNIDILIGVGDGNFTAAGTSPEAVPGGSAGNGPNAIATADFNGDTFNDLAIAAGFNGPNSRVAILLGNGAGDFTPTPTSPENVGNDIPVGITFDQFDAGNLDLAVSNFFPEPNARVNILLNDGPGAATPPVTTPPTTPAPPKKCKKGQKLKKGKCVKKKKKK